MGRLVVDDSCHETMDRVLEAGTGEVVPVLVS